MHLSILKVEQKNYRNNMVSVISYKSGGWSKELNEFEHDFHVSYGAQNEPSNRVEPILLKWESNTNVILLPMLKRKIMGTPYFDLTSVYGYAGPICREKDISWLELKKFQKDMVTYFAENLIISVFSRLHPLFNQENILEGFGIVEVLSQTVSIDLTLPLDLQRRQYRKGVKSDLSKLKQRDLKIIEDKDHLLIADFVSIYNENMLRVGAEKHYFFPVKYYTDLFSDNGVEAKLFFVMEGDIAIAAGIFVFTGDIIQYHLSGTKGDYLQNSPIRLMIDYIRLLGTELGYKTFHLGGGVGSNKDALFNFKAGFSKIRHEFKVWKYIVDTEVYNQLSHELGIDEGERYFPLYRSKEKGL